MSRIRRLRSAFVTSAAGALLIAATVSVAPADAVGVASTPSAVVPSTCGVALHRIDRGVLSRIVVVGQTFSQKTLGTFRRGGIPEQPVALAFTGQSPTNPNVSYFHAATRDGRLWRLTQTEGSSTIGISQVWPSGFAGAKSMVMGASGQLYVVYTTGTFARYRLDSAGRIVGAALVGAAPTWKFARSLGWMSGGTFRGAPSDSLLVVTEAGNLNQYIVSLSTGRVSGFNLRSGWSAYAHLTSGGCDTGRGAPIFGVTKSANGYLWYDRDITNLTGSDLGPIGLKATGLTGLVVD
jgi:hypothetical protein